MISHFVFLYLRYGFNLHSIPDLPEYEFYLVKSKARLVQRAHLHYHLLHHSVCDALFPKLLL